MHYHNAIYKFRAFEYFNHNPILARIKINYDE